MTIDSFNIRRTLRLTARYLSDSRRQLMLQAGSMAGTILIAALLLLLNNYHSYFYPISSPVVPKDPLLEDFSIIYLFGFIIFGCLGASVMFSDLGTRQGRIGVLMRPARSDEKFIARWIVYLPMFIVLYFVAFFIAETIRVATVNYFVDGGSPTPLYVALTDPTFLKSLFVFRKGIASGAAALILFFLALQSFFMLGSCVWPRYSFFKTFCAGLLVFVLYVGGGFVVTTIFSVSGVGEKNAWIQNHDIEIFIVIAAVITLTNWVLTTMRLKETDAITTKR